MKYDFKTQLMFCDECESELGYQIYQRYIVQPDLYLCMSCMEKRLIKGTYVDSDK